MLSSPSLYQGFINRLGLGRRDDVPQLVFGHADPLALVLAERELAQLILGPIPELADLRVRRQRFLGRAVAARLELVDESVRDGVMVLVQLERAARGINSCAVQRLQELLRV